MTRINCIDPSLLNDKALAGEWHELPRVFTLAKDAYWKGVDVLEKTLQRAPSQYTMGIGHVLFFYDKLGWVLARYKQLANEARSRGWNVNELSDEVLTAFVPKMLLNDWQPDEQAVNVNMQRLTEKKGLAQQAQV